MPTVVSHLLGRRTGRLAARALTDRRRRRSAVGLAATLIAVTVGFTLATAPAVSAYSTQTPAIAGISCSADNLTSAWGSVVVPANAISATFTITGGGGAGGDNHGDSGGIGGRGGIVTGTVSVTPGNTVWAKVGCGAPDATGRAAGYTTGGNATNEGGGGGGSTAICINTGAASCSGGTVHGIAGGGGGGGEAFDGCGVGNGGAGGTSNQGSAGSGFGGTSFGGGRGELLDTGGSTAGGGGGGIGQGPGWSTGTNTPNNTGGPAGRGDGTGDSSPGGNATSVSPSGSGGNGGDGAANDGFWGGGGGGFTGGGGGGRGDDGTACDNESGAGAGAGASWVSGSTTSVGWSAATGNTNCSAANIGTSPGSGGTQQVGGCDGNATISFLINTIPTGVNQSLNATKGVGLGITLAANDAAGEGTPTCVNVSTPSKGGLTGSGCSRTYTANANTSGTDSFTYQVQDANGALSVANTITLTIVNRLPTGTAVASPGSNVTKGVAFGFTLAANDLDFDSPLTCNITANPTKGSLGGTANSCTGRTYTANANTTGTDFLTYTVTDSVGGTSSSSYQVFFTIVNRLPVATSQTVTIDAGLPTAITLAGTDPDGDTVPTCTATNGALAKGTLSGTSCARSYVSNAGSANAGIGGADSFTFTVTDSVGGVSAASATVGITVVNPDLSLLKSHTGRFNPGTGTGTYTLLIGNSNVSTANGTTTLVDTLPAGMVYRSFSAGTSGFSCTGTPGSSTTVTCTRATQIPKNFSGSLTISVDVAENAASPVTNSAIISSLYELAATAANNTATDGTTINHRPTANSQSVATDVNTPTVVSLTASDPDSDPLIYQIISGPSHGSLSGAGANKQYSPDTDFQGIDTFTFKVTDDNSLQSTLAATVTIYVGNAKLSGTVTNEVGGAPIAGIQARLVDSTTFATVATAVTNGAGVYDFGSQFSEGAAPFGSYLIRFVDPLNNFIPEYYDNATRDTATPIVLDSSTPTVTRSAALTPGVRIQGTLRSTAGAHPTINNIQVRLYRAGESSGSAAFTTGPDGQYKFEALAADDYQLFFRDVNSGLWISEWYDDQPSQATAATISTTVGQQVLVDEEMAPIVTPPPPTVGSVTGTVRSSQVGNVPISGIQVRLYKEPYAGSAAATTDANGQYTFTNVAAGNYKVYFRVVSGNAYVSEYYNDKPDLATADVIVVGAGATVADAFLSPPAVPQAPSGVVSGTLTLPDTITPIAGIQVRLYVNGQSAGSAAATTDANGFYQFTGKAPGDYQVFFRDLGKTYFSEWNLDKPDQASADPVSVSNFTTTTVDASLTPK